MGYINMSIDSCIRCGTYVDTDYDCEAYVLISEDCDEVSVLACHCEEHRYFTKKNDILFYCNQNKIRIMNE